MDAADGLLECLDEVREYATKSSETVGHLERGRVGRFATESEIVEIAQSIVEELARERRDAGFTRTDAEIEAIERGFRSLSGPGTSTAKSSATIGEHGFESTRRRAVAKIGFRNRSSSTEAVAVATSERHAMASIE